MAKVNQFETTDEDVMINRIRFRNYIRELILNQERIMEKIAQKEAGNDRIQELVEQMQAENNANSSVPDNASTVASSTMDHQESTTSQAE